MRHPNESDDQNNRSQVVKVGNRKMKNITRLLPLGRINSISVCCLRSPNTPFIIRCKRPLNCEQSEAELQKLAPADLVSVHCLGGSFDQMIRVECGCENLDQMEDAITEAAWSLGAWDIMRLSHAPLPDGSDPFAPQHGIASDFGGLGAVYSIVGHPGSIGDKENSDLIERAGKEGYWSWMFKPNRGQQDLYIKIARKSDPTINPDGSRDGTFPGWLRGGRFAGRSGDWWFGLAKSFEVEERPGHGLRMVWDLRTRMLGLRS